MDSNADAAREALLVKAAQAWVNNDDSAPDLAELSPAQLSPGQLSPAASVPDANAARDHALYYLRAGPSPGRDRGSDLTFAAGRGGRGARPARPAPAAGPGPGQRPRRRAGPAGPGASASLVVDIVTDDMPYLVDSVATRLNRHHAEIRMLVHPLLRVRRDVTGELLGIVGLSGDESARPPPGAHRVVDPRRAGAAHRPGYRRTARDGPAPGPRRRAGGHRGQARMEAAAGAWPMSSAASRAATPSEHGALLRWLADGNFTFLGYREYDLVPTRTEPACGPCRAPGSASSATPGKAGRRCASCRPGGGAGPGSGRAAGAGQGELQVHRLPGQLPGLRLGQEARPGRRGHRGVPVPRPVLARGAHRAHNRHSGPPAQAGPGAGDGRVAADSHDGQDLRRDPRGLPARGAFRDLGGRNSPRSRSACCG